MRERDNLLGDFSDPEAKALKLYREKILRTQSDDFTGEISPIPGLHNNLADMLKQWRLDHIDNEVGVSFQQKAQILYHELLKRLTVVGKPYFSRQRLYKESRSEIGLQCVIVTKKSREQDEYPDLEIRYKQGENKHDLHLKHTYTLAQNGAFLQLPYNIFLGEHIERERVIIAPHHGQLSPIQVTAFKEFSEAVDLVFDQPREIFPLKR